MSARGFLPFGYIQILFHNNIICTKMGQFNNFVNHNIGFLKEKYTNFKTMSIARSLFHFHNRHDLFNVTWVYNNIFLNLYVESTKSVSNTNQNYRHAVLLWKFRCSPFHVTLDGVTISTNYHSMVIEEKMAF